MQACGIGDYILISLASEPQSSSSFPFSNLGQGSLALSIEPLNYVTCSEWNFHKLSCSHVVNVLEQPIQYDMVMDGNYGQGSQSGGFALPPPSDNYRQQHQLTSTVTLTMLQIQMVCNYV